MTHRLRGLKPCDFYGTDFNAAEDTVQLNGEASLYRLDFFVSNGVGRANLVYEANENLPNDLIAIFENVSRGDIDLTSSAFQYV